MFPIHAQAQAHIYPISIFDVMTSSSAYCAMSFKQLHVSFVCIISKSIHTHKFHLTFHNTIKYRRLAIVCKYLSASFSFTLFSSLFLSRSFFERTLCLLRLLYFHLLKHHDYSCASTVLYSSTKKRNVNFPKKRENGSRQTDSNNNNNPKNL